MKQSQVVTRWMLSMATIAVSIFWLDRLGDGALGAPPLSVDGAVTWLEQRDTATATFALLRVIALLFGLYLFIVVAAGGAARSLQLARTASLIDRVTLPFARGLIGGMALLGTMSAPAPVRPQSPETMVELPSDPPSAQTATMHLLPDTPAPPAPAPPVPAAPAPSASTPAWRVQPGESFWSIASEHLEESTGRPATEPEVASYWRRVVDHNRSRLVNPLDPNLLFTGQEIELPPVASG